MCLTGQVSRQIEKLLRDEDIPFPLDLAVDCHHRGAAMDIFG
jgi:hypothetical protein